ncbi:iron uptake protein [Alloalcanivorax sp. C16-2]|uniref:iron uptake protein n=1 Tax=Alloalcanivorax TaxID=3020832 RepID=UPI0019349428|nr:iron uptake protein [Alloalcanivorax marinus]MBL7250818.1 iron uptake protein [Alloalcanivorax marinus]
MASLTVSRFHLVSRVAAAVLGGYLFVWGAMALGVAGLFALGMSFHDAEHLCAMLAFLVYLVVFLWSFAAPDLRRVWLILAGGGALMSVLASLIQHALI